MYNILNRELSWIQFNNRVLQEANDNTVPLLRRVQFLGIAANNLDEFIKVRVAKLMFRPKYETGISVLFPQFNIEHDILTKVTQEVTEMRREFSSAFSSLVDELKEHNISFLNNEQGDEELDDKQKEFCYKFYTNIIAPRLTPIMLHHNKPLPFLSDNNVYFGVDMTKGTRHIYSIILIPVSPDCPRFIVLPTGKKHLTDIIFIDDIIRLFIDDIFFMFKYDSIKAYAFKFLRDANFHLDHDAFKSTVDKMKKGILSRTNGQPIQFVYDKQMPRPLVNILSQKLGVKDPGNIIKSRRYQMLKNLMDFPQFNKALQIELPPVIEHPQIAKYRSFFAAIKRGDILLHYPYHSFNHVIDFLRESALDPHVTCICITLYRTASHSKIINALINAAQNGKQVMVYTEIKARFDEVHNISLMGVLQNAGVSVIPTIESLKVHAKVITVDRQEAGRTQTYSYISTGNFNEITAKIYTDFGLFTRDENIGQDLHKLFDFLQVNHLRFNCKKLLISPYDMRPVIIRLIQGEIRNARKGKPAYIYAMMNKLTDLDIIEQLYLASDAGVRINLIVRGSCCLQVDTPHSENIAIKSIVDNYLEHTRLLLFCNNNDVQPYIGSADWMNRNLSKRVEVMTPIDNPKIKQTLADIFQLLWNDNTKARTQIERYTSKVIKDDNTPTLRAQQEIYNYYQK